MWEHINREDAKRHVKPGWHGLLDEVYDKVPDGIEIQVIKEKFGGLRIYTSLIDKDNQDFGHFLLEIENRSKEIYEFCGEPATHFKMIA